MNGRVCKRASRRTGFTLLELMVALSIMSIAIIALLRVVVGNLNATADARDRTIAASLAQTKLHDIVLDPQQQTKENSGNFGDEYKYFSWTSSTRETKWPTLKQVVVTVYWIRGKRSRQVSIDSLIRSEEPDTGQTSTSSPSSPSPGAAGGSQ